MAKIVFNQGDISELQQQQLSAGFESHSEGQDAPAYLKQKLNWTVQDDNGALIAALTGSLLWEWLYIDELWVAECCRGTGMGKQLMEQAEAYAREQRLCGLWLWTQSWQAPKFYQSLGFEEFTRFDNFPTGHSRIGLRKTFVD